MARKGKATWILIFGISAIIVVAYMASQPNEAAPAQWIAFQRVFNLTPDNLQSACGRPALYGTGLVADGDGTKDFIYYDKDQNKLALRFIWDGRGHWTSVGAWQSLDHSGGIGSEVDDSEALVRLSCLQSVSVSRATNDATLVVRQRNVNHYYRTVQEVPRLPETPRVPERPPTIPQTPTVPGGSSGGIGTNAPQLEVPPGAGGPGPGGGETPAQRAIPLPCPSSTLPCEVIDYADYVAEQKQAVEAAKENDFERLQRGLERGKYHYVIVQIPELEIDRKQAIQEIVRLESQVINVVVATLRDDVAKMSPFPNDSPEQKRQKMSEVLRDERERRELWRSAAASTRSASEEASKSSQASSDNSSDSSSSKSGLHFDSEAYRQGVQIHLTGKWPD